MYSLNLLAMAMELAHDNPAYEDVASKFWEHFLYIAHAMGHQGKDKGLDLWDDEDGFFYDDLRFADGTRFPLKVRSMVGLIPLFAVETLEPELLERLPGLQAAPRVVRRASPRPDRQRRLHADARSASERRLLSVVTADRLQRVLRYMLDENEFLSPYGIRALSRYHRDHPYRAGASTATSIASTTSRASRRRDCSAATPTGAGRSGSRSNYLLIESLQKFHHYFGDDFKVECPTGSGQMLTLAEVAAELSRRLSRIFLRDDDGRRPVFGDVERFQQDPHWRDLRAVPRVLPRRHRPRRRREPSDRLDGAGRQAAAAERRVSGQQRGPRAAGRARDEQTRVPKVPSPKCRGCVDAPAPSSCVLRRYSV